MHVDIVTLVSITLAVGIVNLVVLCVFAGMTFQRSETFRHFMIMLEEIERINNDTQAIRQDWERRYTRREDD